MAHVAPTKPDHGWLFEIASEQMGHFTAEQARECGFSWALLSYFVRTGRFIRLRRGLYRLRDFPSAPREEVMAAWLAAGKDTAVVSHESALDLLDLSDVIPNSIHLTVPRTRSNAPALPGVTIHTTTRTLRPNETMYQEGMRITAPIRTILDTAERGTMPDQVERATIESVRRGLLLPHQLREEAAQRGGRVARLITRALAAAEQDGK